MPRYSKELFNYIIRKLGGQPDAAMTAFQQLPEVVRDNWLAAFGDINLPGAAHSRKSVRLRGNTLPGYGAEEGTFIPPHVNQYTGRVAPPIIKTRYNPSSESILHEGIHNLDNALYAAQHPTELEHAKSFFLPTFKNLGDNVTEGVPSLIHGSVPGYSAPAYALEAAHGGDIAQAKAVLWHDPHGSDYYKAGDDLNWDLISTEGIAQMLSQPRYFNKSKPYIAAVEAIEQNPLTRYDITFDNLMRENNNVFENKPVFVTRTGNRLRPQENSGYVNILRAIPETGLKPIDIKEQQVKKRSPQAVRADARGQNTTAWAALNKHGLIKMLNRRAYITDEGHRLLDELDRASKVQPDKARIGGLYNY